MAFYVVYIQEAHPTDLWQMQSNVRDGIANATERSYTGWPDRLYLIARGGRVLFKSDPGPFGFEPKGLERALESVKASL